MGWLGKLFGSDTALKSTAKIAENITGGIINGVDKIFYTDEEKAEWKLKFYEASSKVLLEMRDQFTPRAISRRVLAFMFACCFCGSFVLSLIFVCLGRFDIVNNIIDLIKAYDLGAIIITIVIFYFGNYMIDKFVSKNNSK